MDQEKVDKCLDFLQHALQRIRFISTSGLYPEMSEKELREELSKIRLLSDATENIPYFLKPSKRHLFKDDLQEKLLAPCFENGSVIRFRGLFNTRQDNSATSTPADQ